MRLPRRSRQKSFSSLLTRYPFRGEGPRAKIRDLHPNVVRQRGSGRLAQLARAPARQAGGRRFEPFIAHWFAASSRGASILDVASRTDRRPQHFLALSEFTFGYQEVRQGSAEARSQEATDARQDPPSQEVVGYRRVTTVSALRFSGAFRPLCCAVSNFVPPRRAGLVA